jgi:UDP-glucose 4-epimerase
MSILVTGGAGYIGGVTVERLQAAGESVVVLDDLSRGRREALDPDVPCYEGSIGDRALVRRILESHDVDACVHFAAFAYVGESVSEPRLYYENNVGQGLALLGALLDGGVKRMVFSSTCATYGEPERVPIDESHPQRPTNPYGWSKYMFERVLRSYDEAYGLRFVALRYFNAAGATPRHGEHHDPETHLIPLVIDAALGRRPHVSVFGTDYPTPDGTAIRDYIHVTDLAEAHIRAVRYLREGGSSRFLNLGTGRGASVTEVIQTVERVMGAPVPVRHEGRRPGDPARLVASADEAKRVLGWVPEQTSLETIVRTAWESRRTSS